MRANARRSSLKQIKVIEEVQEVRNDISETIAGLRTFYQKHSYIKKDEAKALNNWKAKIKSFFKGEKPQ